MGWGSILHNALNDAKGIVDPRNAFHTLEKTGLAAAKSSLGQPEDAFKIGKNFVNSYVGIAKHPMREFQNHPVNTALAFAPLPIGKAAAVLGEGRAATAFAATGSTRAGQLAHRLGVVNDFTGKRLPARLKEEHGVWKSTKYDPGTGVPRRAFAGTVPGARVDTNLLDQLQADLGHPNSTHRVGYPGKEALTTKGLYNPITQDATTFLQPNHLHPSPAAAHSASADLTESMLHEARHGHQDATWSRGKKFADAHRFYPNQKREIDANQFMTANSEKYKGLVKVDAGDPNIPLSHLPGGGDLHKLGQMVKDLEDNVPGLTPEDVLQHAEDLVHRGLLHPDNAMELEQLLMRRGSYKPPQSAQELFARAVEQAKVGRKNPTFNGNKAAAIRNSLNEPLQAR